ncbi:MAG: hypothetical protein J2P55_00180 [Rhizobiales bacterium]|nr:hypothetical protein [Hyphomicrobiales bacterium]
MTELERLQRQNRILRKLLSGMATIVSEIFEVLPDEYQALENVQRAKRISAQIMASLAELELKDSQEALDAH